MAGKHRLIGLIVSQDCACTVAERRSEETRSKSAELIKTKENNICAERSWAAASFHGNSDQIAFFFSSFTIRCCCFATFHSLRNNCSQRSQELMMISIQQTVLCCLFSEEIIHILDRLQLHDLSTSYCT